MCTKSHQPKHREIETISQYVHNMHILFSSTFSSKPLDNAPKQVYNEYRRTNVRFSQKHGRGTVWRRSRRGTARNKQRFVTVWRRVDRRTDIVFSNNKRGDFFDAWRLAALGSGDASRYTGDLPLRRSADHAQRGLLRRIARRPIPYVGGEKRLAALRSGGIGRAILRQVYFFALF